MPINSIIIMCLPCTKCKALIEYIEDGIRTIEREKKVNVIYHFEHIKDFKRAVKYGVRPADAPFVFINGQVELSGRQLTPAIVKRKLESIQNY